MLDQTVTGGFASPAVDAAHTFRTAMDVMARPGEIKTLDLATAPSPVSPAAAALLLTLCDAETPLFLAGDHDTPEVRGWVAFHTGAPIVGPETAQFALGGWQNLLPLTRFPVGTPEYPDRSTTLIVEVETLAQEGARLTGPGIQTEARLTLPDTQPFRDNRALFPCGLDFYFTAGSRIAALPRTTLVEAG